MSIFDVRTDTAPNITQLKFGDFNSKTATAQYIERYKGAVGGIKVVDDYDEFVVVSDKAHAENLIKALETAIELGWVE
jgi:hypothetical protein